MHNIRLVIEYNGSAFHGWQKQESMRTIQEELHKNLEIVLRQKISHVQASGRTDQGVHARAQVVNFFVPELPDLDRLRYAISSLMRPELNVHLAEEVPADFHSLRSALAKTYVYTIYNHDVPPVLDYGRVWFVRDPLNITLMQERARELEGIHDFKSLQASGCGVKKTSKEIFKSEITSRSPYVVYTVTGSGFLKQMVRNIVGTLVEYSKGEGKTKSFAELLQLKDRTMAGPTAPPYGLCLQNVYYTADQIPKV